LLLDADIVRIERCKIREVVNQRTIFRLPEVAQQPNTTAMLPTSQCAQAVQARCANALINPASSTK